MALPAEAREIYGPEDMGTMEVYDQGAESGFVSRSERQ